jgi:hypothetical protein
MNHYVLSAWSLLPQASDCSVDKPDRGDSNCRHRPSPSTRREARQPNQHCGSPAQQLQVRQRARLLCVPNGCIDLAERQRQ